MCMYVNMHMCMYAAPDHDKCMDAYIYTHTPQAWMHKTQYKTYPSVHSDAKFPHAYTQTYTHALIQTHTHTHTHTPHIT
jgi:hypothetical protein